MGIFTNSETENKRNQILRDVVVVNKALHGSAKVLDMAGIDWYSIDTVNELISSVESKILNISTTVQSMSDSQLDGFKVPWIDGGYIGIMMWLLSTSMLTQQIANDFEKFIKSN